MSRNKVQREIRICPKCRKQFEVRITSTKKYCSRECYYEIEVGNSYRPKRNKITKRCENCSTFFKTYEFSKQKYCSKKCVYSSKKRNERISKSFKAKHNFGEKNLNYLICPICGCIKKILTKHIKEKHKLSKGEFLKLYPNQKLICDETKIKRSKSLTGKKMPQKAIQKIRIALLNRIEKNYGIPSPFYTPQACEFFKQFDKAMETKGRYAVYGGGEYNIKELGYFPDYINFDLKLIIECDDPSHFNLEGNLKQKDIQRQQEIQEFYPDFTFIRITTEEIEKILEVKIGDKT